MPSMRDGPGLVTTIVYVVDVPATTVDRPSVLAIDTSASPLTMVASVAMLLALLGSITAGGASTVAVLVTTPSWLAAIDASIVNVADPPVARSTVEAMSPAPLVVPQVDPGVAVQVHDTPVRPDGITSVTRA